MLFSCQQTFTLQPMEKGFFSLHSCQYLLFDNSHPNRCEVVFYCGFDLHFPDCNVEHLFISLVRHFVSSLKNVYSGPPPIFFKLGYSFFLLLSCISSLYILNINPFIRCLLFIFSPNLQTAFHFLSFFCGTEAFQFNVVLVIYFSFCCLCLWCDGQISMANIKELFPCFL